MRQGTTVNYLYGDHQPLLGCLARFDQPGHECRRRGGVGGALPSSWAGEPYGQVYWQWGATQTDIGFTGQRLDGFGLMDYNARYYDPMIGRFISPDTLIPQPGSPLAWDRYSYTFNNPIRHSDPSGLMRIEDNGDENHFFYPHFDPVVIDYRGKWKKQREERAQLPDVGKASTALSINNYLDRFIGIVKFYKYIADFSEIADMIDNFRIPSYKQIKGSLPGGPILEGGLGFATQLWIDISDSESSWTTKDLITRGFIVEDGITDTLSSGLEVTLGGTAGGACGPVAPVCMGVGHLLGENTFTTFMDRLVWKEENSYFPIMRQENIQE